MSWWSNGARALFIAGCLLAGAVGWFTTSHVGASSNGTAAGTVNIYGCPMAGATSIGQLHTGDAVWLIGVTDHRWAVIRHPSTQDRPAWVPLAMIRTSADAGDLPEISCTTDPSTGTTAPVSTSPATTVVGASTTTTAPASTTSTSTTISTDTTPPVVTVTADRDFLYVSPAPKCAGQDILVLTVVVADPTLPLWIRKVDASWAGAGSLPPENVTSLDRNRFSLQITGNGPSSSDIPVTITVTAEDGVGNVGSAELIVQLRNPATNGCV